MNRCHTAAAVLAAVLASAPAALAQSEQSYPNQVVKIIAPVSAGSIADGLSRVIADKLQDIWKQTVIVENRPGPPGNLSVAKSKPDGYTLMLTSNGHVIADIISKSSGFDPIKDFVGVAKVASVPLVLVASPTVPANTLQELIALAKKAPGQFNYGSAGLASTAFLATQLFTDTTKTNFVHVPYKGAGEAITGLIRGDSHIYFLGLNLAIELVKTGKLKAIAVATPQRSPALPEVPTFAEAGLPQFQYDAWFGVMAPAGTPEAVLDKASQDIGRVLQMPDVVARLEGQGVHVATSKWSEFDALMKSDGARYRKLMQAANIGGN